ncbi:polysaccharide deacetylase family protein [Dermatophilus congolensis]|uniref:Poly-beta-1,6-N-acetyl-D-glucosamine N-deacetylase n=1 Tax=Dermatophilus congolensis TaxID=1863 RepID=A0A239V9L5_9MICO|nr:polysaccharide deacetylase family protein [Dermatophilus congolensis]MBO3130581.1 polysaccharide deacetylase family protein [Dermatophilus congolensis]MBO3130789.1 polysaccharide deacetylase family protein [Dermatophilus congolensis]MBO3135054.1 polysaccharide deacetylase family protein [Dermatophilus congolensis]MBO3137293.1 polysaccharide deacetylase family protein [Dermatophilus congolensis]MBO3139537.1 polysaccharide deacetylase family protein [Dermatophilus congolensis]
METPLNDTPTLTRRTVISGALGVTGLACLSACGANNKTADQGTNGHNDSSSTQNPTNTPGTPAQMAARTIVPVLCYHQVRDWTSEDTEYTRSILVLPPDRFSAQLDAIKNAGYTTISGDQYHQHITTGAPLPPKPVMLTFDDGKDNQHAHAFRILKEKGMTGTFFIMTVVIGNNGWVTKANIKEMADAGMTIGAHTWDHHRVDQFTQSQLQQQLLGPRQTLEKITGKPVLDLAYPYGVWDADGADLVKKAGYRAAYQLQDKPVDPTRPLYTIRRQLAGATITAENMPKTLQGFATAGKDSRYSG